MDDNEQGTEAERTGGVVRASRGTLWLRGSYARLGRPDAKSGEPDSGPPMVSPSEDIAAPDAPAE